MRSWPRVISVSNDGPTRSWLKSVRTARCLLVATSLRSSNPTARALSYCIAGEAKCSPISIWHFTSTTIFEHPYTLADRETPPKPPARGRMPDLDQHCYCARHVVGLGGWLAATGYNARIVTRPPAMH